MSGVNLLLKSGKLMTKMLIPTNDIFLTEENGSPPPPQPRPIQLLTVREELVPRIEDECVNEKPLAEEGGKKERKKVLDIPMLDHNYLVMLPTNIKIKKVRKEGNDL